METIHAKAIGEPNADQELMRTAGDIIRRGGLVAIPTETVYGLAGDALNPDSARKIYAAKGRPSDNPLIVHIAAPRSLDRIARTVPEAARLLAERFWPGPLTIVLPKTGRVPDETTGGLSTVAVRMPLHPIALEFIEASGGFIAAPSANRSGRPSCTTAEHVAQDLDGKIEMIIDGGAVGIGLESTIVDVSGKTPCLLRPGYISLEQLRETLGEVEIDPSVAGMAPQDAPPRAPGMKYRHYAPKGSLFLVRGKEGDVVRRIDALMEGHKARGERAAAIVSRETRPLYHCGDARVAGPKQDGETVAHNLFAILRQLDDDGVSYIYSEEFDAPGLGMAIMNRLLKAAGHHIIDAKPDR